MSLFDAQPFAPVRERPSLANLGEQPGDREDVEGHPFVGPAGRVLDDRGRPQESELADLVTLTAHPSSILRAYPERPRAMGALVDDLAGVGRWIAERSAGGAEQRAGGQ